LLAFDKFRGAFTASEACEAAAAALGQSWTRLKPTGPIGFDCCPVADGGEGTVDAVVGATRGKRQPVRVSDALGEPVDAAVGIVAKGGDDLRATDRRSLVGVVEMSAASGLDPLAGRQLDPWRASTFGTGQLMLAAARLDVTQLVVGLGGSATNDGGSGFALALGAGFLDKNGRFIVNIPEYLDDVKEIDLSGISPLPPVLVASDVTNPLLGELGATRVFGPQKGVKPEDIGRHEERLAHWADLVEAAVGRHLRDRPGSGAAGGLGFGLIALLATEIRSGFEVVAEQIDLEQRVRRSDLVITGEGKLDSQTLDGKAPAGVAALARRCGKPVVAVAGQVDPSTQLTDTFDLVIALQLPGEPPDQTIAAGSTRLAEVLSTNERLREFLRPA
jgi:glycerate kinase